MQFEKVVVAPQIVIYKNIFKHSKELIELLETDHADSLFSKWDNWYEQGYRKHAVLNSSLNNDSDYAKKENDYLLEISKIIDLVNKDYFEDFGKDNGMWPTFIKDWSIVSGSKDNIAIDYFKYDIEKIGKRPKDILMMEYHVDDFLLDLSTQFLRHVTTINLYLNDEYSGGEICAYDAISNKSYMYKPAPGDIVVMPSTEPFYHAVKVFEDANRYFLRVFVDYPVSGDSNIKEFNQKYEDYVKQDLQMIKISAVEEVIN